jgi:hypothetical protein
MAISGSQVYRDLNQNLDEARASLAHAGKELERATAERERIRAQQAGALAALARVRLDELAAERVAGGFDDADRRALDLLDQRRAALERVRAAIRGCEDAQRELEQEREGALTARDAARAARDERANAALAELAKTEQHAFQLARVERATSQAAHADRKAQQAEADREHKGRPYESDKLFAYLWRRRYAFPEYRANRLVRAMDDWVARLCRYERAHRDYRMLLEIPRRLRAHADALAAEAGSETQALAGLESQALADAGVGALDATLARAVAALEGVEKQLDEREREHAALLEERATLEAGDDPATSEAVATLTRQLDSEDAATLRGDARRTQTAEDDRLVEELAVLREQLRDAVARVGEYEAQQQRALRTVADFEEMRRRFRRQRYDSDDSVFDDGFDAGALFGGLLRGALVLGDAWGRLGRQQRYRRRSSSSSTGAEIAGQILGGILSSVGRSGRSGGGFGGGGGFRSGGGFGGGGFRTGGGF